MLKVGKQQRRQHCDVVDAIVLVRRQAHAPVRSIGSDEIIQPVDYACEREDKCFAAGRMPGCPLNEFRQ